MSVASGLGAIEPESIHEEEENEEPQMKKEEDEERKTLARNESIAVGCLRLLVLLVLAGTTILVSLAVNDYTKNDQEDDFHKEFNSHARTLIESFHEAVERKLTAIDNLASIITSYANIMGQQWPNVTVPDWYIHAATARILADAIIIYFMPVLTEEQRLPWEAYGNVSRSHLMPEFFMEDALRKKQDVDFGYAEPPLPAVPDASEKEMRAANATVRRLGLSHNPDPMHTHDSIWGLQEEWQLGQPPGTGPYFPAWHISPVIPTPYILFYNMASHVTLRDSLLACKETEMAVMDKIAPDNRDPEDIKGDAEGALSFFLSVSQYRHELQEYQFDPVSSLVYPVFDSFLPHRKMVGTLFVNLYWRLYFANILPEAAKGLVVVLKDDYGQAVTYRVDGPTVTYVGPSDRHDPKYDDMYQDTEITEFVKERSSPKTRTYLGVGLSNAVTNYYLYVYPSDDLRDEFINNEPLFYTIVVASIFIFTSLVFLSYDALVEYRQRKVMTKAVRSSAIVSSLFPKAVRARLFEPEPELRRSNKSSRSKGTWEIKEEEESDAAEKSDKSKKSGKDKGIIADLYPNCTILFADMAGFTKWSSVRTPTEVFQLLEALYQSFDVLANRRRVFKVETVGDCYVAAAGLPDPRPDHAIVMCKFARDCMEKMTDVLESLVEDLGSDTRELGFRVGLHSGPVTAGVLRGSKSRFQLFGDTVNTASRMESNGVAGRIHVSQSTADELTALGKQAWITPREDKIIAKGKGEMQTYWVEITDRALTETASSHLSSLGEDDDDSKMKMDLNVAEFSDEQELTEATPPTELHVPKGKKSKQFSDNATTGTEESSPTRVGQEQSPDLEEHYNNLLDKMRAESNFEKDDDEDDKK